MGGEAADKRFWRTVAALFMGSIVVFGLFYCTQPLLPIFSAYFGITPLQSSLSLSVTTAGMVVGMLGAAKFSGRWSRKTTMLIALSGGVLLEIGVAYSPNFTTLLMLRGLQGFFLAGFPASAMAYVAEEFPAQQAGMVMGLYISGSSIGGMAGRLAAGWFTHWYSWRSAMLFMAIVAGLAVVGFFWTLPKSAHGAGAPGETVAAVEALRRSIVERRLLYLYFIGFLVMGAFVALYNYISYSLMGAPYFLSAALVGSLFLIYGVGSIIAPGIGWMAGRFSYGQVLIGCILAMLLGAGITLSLTLSVKFAGMAVFTAGFFGCHTMISGWIGRCATFDRAQAAAWYLVFYYSGSASAGTVGGYFWSHYGWNGVIAMIAGLLSLALILHRQLQSNMLKK